MLPGYGMKSFRLAIKLLVSLLFFGLIFREVSGPEFSDMLRAVEIRYVAMSVALSAVMIAVSCWKWHVLLRHQATPVPYPVLFRLYLVGYYFTSLLPSNVGGDVARSYYVGRRIGSQSDAAVSVFIERVSGLLLLLGLVILAPALRPALYARPAVAVPALGAAALLVVLAALIRVRQPLKRSVEAIEAWRSRHGGGRFAAGLEALVRAVRDKALRFHQKLGRALHALKRDRSVLVPVLVLTVMFYGLTWVNVYVSFRAFGVQVPFLDVAAVVPVCMLVAMIPVAPLASLGLAEGTYVFYFGLLGVPAAASLAMGLLLRCKLLFIGLVGCLLYLGQDERLPAGRPGAQHE